MPNDEHWHKLKRTHMNRTRIVAGSNMAADYPLVIKDYVSYLKITLRINFKIKIEYVKLLF